MQDKKAQNSVKFLSAKKKMHSTTLFYIVVLHNVYEHQTKVAFDLMADSCQSSCGSQLLIKHCSSTCIPGSLHLELNRFKDAEKVYRDLLRRNPENRLYYQELEKSLQLGK